MRAEQLPLFAPTASNDAISLVPTSIPDSLPRFGSQGVDVIRTLAAASHPGTVKIMVVSITQGQLELSSMAQT